MRPTRSNAFTLVELLVVIGIVAVLISMLLPALKKARAAAQSAACMSNLRQQVQAAFLYAQQNKGQLPYGFVDTGNGAPMDQSARVYAALRDAKLLPQTGLRRVYLAGGT